MMQATDHGLRSDATKLLDWSTDRRILSTFGSLARHGYRMDVQCWRCERSVTIDAAAFPAEKGLKHG